ncbi:hypothetical protein [Streptomyces sp. 5-6(2022)]|uniref:hypothetical protein n=1 Tax=Streptomyces sp. 5-6(2022) TaxID=2936510 RepID=UPI0023B9F1CF|nr:hypothetical protein [Streptomyces sp. 5-6(2022)]
MATRQELLALAANTENLIDGTPEPAAHQIEMRDRIIAAARAAGITDEEIKAARQTQ